MTPETRRQAAFYSTLLFLGGMLAALCWWTFSRPRTPLEYMVLGTLGTAILLAAAFVQIVKRGYLGKIRKTESSAAKLPTELR